MTLNIQMLLNLRELENVVQKTIVELEENKAIILAKEVKYCALQNEFQKKIKTINSYISELSHKITNLNTENRNILTCTGNIKQEISQTEEKLNVAKSQLCTAEDSLTDASHSLHIIAMLICRLVSSLTDLSIQRVSLKTKIHDIGAKV